ncbi:MAG: hypothetical protein LBI18_14285, partial [Planctomycetaceae bacterium]|nr:hypothetical protein [Planctomycetaceae bacterium]
TSSRIEPLENRTITINQKHGEIKNSVSSVFKKILNTENTEKVYCCVFVVEFALVELTVA